MKKEIIGTISLIGAVCILALTWILVENSQVGPIEIKKSVELSEDGFVDYTIQADEEVEMKLESGTRVVIPAGAFKDEEGKPVKGEVQVRFREFHDAESIYLSGIPMEFGSGNDQFFKSGGMFELRASQEGRPLALKKGKNVQVDLASFQEVDEDFNLYFMNSDGTWTENGEYTRVPNQLKKIALEEVADPILANGGKSFRFKLASNYERNPHLKHFRNTVWETEGKYDAKKLKRALRRDWDQVSIKTIDQEKLTCEIVFSKTVRDYSQNTKKYQFKVKARPAGELFEQKKSEFIASLKAYERTSEQIAQERARIEMEADMLNLVKIDRLGVWNVDKIEDKSSLAHYSVGFDFEDQIDPMINKLTLVVLLDDENAVLTYNFYRWKDVALVKGSNCRMFVVLPSGELAVVEAEEFKRKTNTGYYHLDFKTVKKKREEFLSVSS